MQGEDVVRIICGSYSSSEVIILYHVYSAIELVSECLVL